MTRPRRLIGIMAKAPIAGQAKTRLIPLLGAQGAAMLYHQMLLDSIDLAAEALDGDGDVSIVSPNDEHYTILKGIVPEHVQVVVHAPGDLMQGLDDALTSFIQAAYQQVILFNGDSPTLPQEYLRSAFDLLKDDTVVLGPTLDGGYYLIGSCRPQTTLFRWDHLDSATLCRQTQARAAATGARVALLPSWFDVDTPADFSHLVAALETSPLRASRTRQFLERGIAND